MRKPIKPCPFCGSFNLQSDELEDEGKKIFYVCCENCGALGPTSRSVEQAVIDWEIRVPDIPRPQASTPPLIAK